MKTSTDREAIERQNYDLNDRFFIEDGEWFYTTRENLAIGPYASQEKAQMGLDAYLEYLQVDLDNDRPTKIDIPRSNQKDRRQKSH
ncbi:DUF6316 family protein [Hahella ganghwensis]|uniref:DUF6316 family protein n=1 Tax=Hahella ganghwensis TaxID=286420 RepID=UPI00037B2B2A|nr:DUF6316 family protein [Hahella ganghwensis]